MKCLHPILYLTFFVFPLITSSQSLENSIEEILENYNSSEGPGIAVAAVKNGEILYYKALGYADIAAGDKLLPDDVFRIGSITKQFTSVGILNLVEEGKLNLDDKISEFIENVPEGKNFSIFQLLTHTSGLGNQTDVPEFSNNELDLGAYPDNMIEPILNSNLIFESGKGYAYSNLGYILLGYVIEQTSGLTFEEYLKSHLFSKLGMDHTGFEYDSSFPFKVVNGYSARNGEYHLSETIDMRMPYSAGGMVSILNDLIKWNAALISGQVISKDHLELIMNSFEIDGSITHYSLGWQIGNVQGIKSVKHDGIVNGFTSIGIYIPEKDVYVIALSNCDCNRDIEVPTSRIVAEILEKPFLQNNISMNRTELGNFTGIFLNGDLERTISLEDDQLFFYQKGGYKRKIYPVAEATLKFEDGLEYLFYNESDTNQGFTIMDLNHLDKWKRIGNQEAYVTMDLSEDELDEYLGKYQIQENFVFQVTREGKTLRGQIGGDVKEVFCYSKDKFRAKDTDATLQFMRNDEGKIDRVLLKLGMDMPPALKIE